MRRQQLIEKKHRNYLEGSAKGSSKWHVAYEGEKTVNGFLTIIQDGVWVLLGRFP